MLHNVLLALVLLGGTVAQATEQQVIRANTPQALRASLQRLSETTTHAEYVKFVRAAASLAILRRPGGLAHPEQLLTMFGMGFALLSMPLLVVDLLPDDQGYAAMYPRLAPVVEGKTPEQVRRDAVAALRPVIEARLMEIEEAQAEGFADRPAAAKERAALERARETLEWLGNAF